MWGPCAFFLFDAAGIEGASVVWDSDSRVSSDAKPGILML